MKKTVKDAISDLVSIGWTEAELMSSLPKEAVRNYFAWQRVAEIDTSLKISNFPELSFAAKRLEPAEILTLGDLLSNSEAQLFRIPRLGRKTVIDIKGVLNRMGILPVLGQFQTEPSASTVR